MVPGLPHSLVLLLLNLIALPLSTSSPSPQQTSPIPIGPETDPCFVTEHHLIERAIQFPCKAITLANVTAPPSISIELSNLAPSSTVTLVGLLTFSFTNSSSFTPLIISNSSSVTILGSPGATIDGQGALYWDGHGSNGGIPKSNHFIELTRLSGDTVVRDLTIRNWPVHCFSITQSTGVTLRNLTLDNRAGDAPNDRSDGKPAGHNTDAFDISSSSGITVEDSVVFNQDDCVAITSGDSILARNLSCSGGHGLSIGSVGGKANNTVSNVIFANSTILNSQNGARIKTNYNTTGQISNVTWEGITMGNISRYGIVVQQDYLNGGPTGTPTNGVKIEGVLFKDVVGTMGDGEKAQGFYVLCGEGSCQDVRFENVKVTGGEKDSSCNYPPEGCPKT